jgi:hypothetical protein
MWQVWLKKIHDKQNEMRVDTSKSRLLATLELDEECANPANQTVMAQLSIYDASNEISNRNFQRQRPSSQDMSSRAGRRRKRPTSTQARGRKQRTGQ